MLSSPLLARGEDASKKGPSPIQLSDVRVVDPVRGDIVDIPTLRERYPGVRAKVDTSEMMAPELEASVRVSPSSSWKDVTEHTLNGKVAYVPDFYNPKNDTWRLGTWADIKVEYGGEITDLASLVSAFKASRGSDWDRFLIIRESKRSLRIGEALGRDTLRPKTSLNGWLTYSHEWGEWVPGKIILKSDQVGRPVWKGSFFHEPDRFRNKLKALTGVTGVGYGQNNDKEAAIFVFVKSKKTRTSHIPTRIGNTPVIVTTKAEGGPLQTIGLQMRQAVGPVRAVGRSALRGGLSNSASEIARDTVQSARQLGKEMVADPFTGRIISVKTLESKYGKFIIVRNSEGEPVSLKVKDPESGKWKTIVETSWNGIIEFERHTRRWFKLEEPMSERFTGALEHTLLLDRFEPGVALDQTVRAKRYAHVDTLTSQLFSPQAA